MAVKRLDVQTQKQSDTCISRYMYLYFMALLLYINASGFIRPILRILRSYDDDAIRGGLPIGEFHR